MAYKSFQEYWDNHACREYVETHEERARKAWHAALTTANDLKFTIRQLLDMLESNDRPKQSNYHPPDRIDFE